MARLQRNVDDWPWWTRLPYQAVAAFASIFALPGTALALSLLLVILVILIAAGAIWALTAGGWVIGQAWSLLWIALGYVLAIVILAAPLFLVGRAILRHRGKL
jgi:hypothetical protein